MVDAEQSETEFILVPAGGPYVQQWCARGTILLSTGVPVLGLLQARQERKCGLQVSGEVAEDIVGELESECMVCRVLSVVVPCRSPPSPAAGDFAFLYRPRRGRITYMPHYSAIGGGMVRRVAE
jgi:hypothetical protein